MSAHEYTVTPPDEMRARLDYYRSNAADYGVPQTRRRAFLIATRDGRQPLPPDATHVSMTSATAKTATANATGGTTTNRVNHVSKIFGRAA